MDRPNNLPNRSIKFIWNFSYHNAARLWASKFTLILLVPHKAGDDFEVLPFRGQQY